MYIFICTSKQWQLLYDFIKILVISTDMKKPFLWYCCFKLTISPYAVGHIT